MQFLFSLLSFHRTHRPSTMSIQAYALRRMDDQYPSRWARPRLSFLSLDFELLIALLLFICTLSVSSSPYTLSLIAVLGEFPLGGLCLTFCLLFSSIRSGFRPIYRVAHRLAGRVPARWSVPPPPPLIFVTLFLPPCPLCPTSVHALVRTTPNSTPDYNSAISLFSSILCHVFTLRSLSMHPGRVMESSQCSPHRCAKLSHLKSGCRFWTSMRFGNPLATSPFLFPLMICQIGSNSIGPSLSPRLAIP